MGLGGPNDWLGGSRKARAWPPEDGRMTPCAVGRERVPIDALEPIDVLVTIGSSIISKLQILHAFLAFSSSFSSLLCDACLCGSPHECLPNVVRQ
jgi:hypothetical protein